MTGAPPPRLQPVSDPPEEAGDTSDLGVHSPEATATSGNPEESEVSTAAPDLETPETPGGVLTKRSGGTPFEVHLEVFSGPFDLLLGLISKHKLDITEVALAQVTDEFVAHIKKAQEADSEWDLGQASEFLLVASTLLDLKAARLLPQLGPEDEEDLALIEARDLLFARLLQYRAFKDIAASFGERMDTTSRMAPRRAGLDERFTGLLPELVMGVTPEQLAMVAARALTPRPEPTVGLEHLHAPVVSVREQASLLVDRLRRDRLVSFRDLVADADGTVVIVARFLALLELFREAAIALEQEQALGEITVRWTGDDEGNVDITDEFDEPDRSGPPEDQQGDRA